MLIYTFQEELQTLKQALKTADHEKWLAASEEEYNQPHWNGHMEIGVAALWQEANQVQVEICDKSQWPLQGKTCCKRLYTGTGNRLQRNLFSRIEIWINLIHLSSHSSPWLGNRGNGCQNSIPLWRVKRGDTHGTTRRFRSEGTRKEGLQTC